MRGVEKAFTRTPADFTPKRRNGHGRPDVSHSITVMLAQGRTCPGLQTMADLADVNRLADRFGYEIPYGWTQMSSTQRLDLIATHLVEKSRGGHARHSEFILSPYQYYMAVRTEASCSPESLQALIAYRAARPIYWPEAWPHRDDPNKRDKILAAANERAQRHLTLEEIERTAAS